MGSEPFHSYTPSAGHGLAHDPFYAIVGPRPIGWISSLDEQGRSNLAPYSFFNAFCFKPPIIGFASSGWKDTVANIKATGEFVWNLVTLPLAEPMNISSAAVPHEISEFDLAHLERLPSEMVRPPRVAASPVHFECRLTQILQLQGIEGVLLENWMVFGEVVRVHIRADLVADGIYRTARAQPVLRAGGRSEYASIAPEAMFDMARPTGDEDLARLIEAAVGPARDISST
ncbi:flavin reductase family protein [Beijerinckia mobilis]|uniref:flavin reductase family protein n=1 Tax=Beijerinckia mobilis TaxID=231434 RepID=UPI0006906426|nr:flavin reductase family protein [Beijerinckia mobilis]